MKPQISSAEKLVSIWDGWERQCYGLRIDYTGAMCALGWAESVAENVDDEFNEFTRVGSTIRRVGEFILLTAPLGSYDMYNESSITELRDSLEFCSINQAIYARAVALANNALRWTPARFRQVDMRLQRAELKK